MEQKNLTDIAVSAMKQLGVIDDAIDQFINEGKVMQSVAGMLFWASKEQQEVINRIETENAKCKVFGVIPATYRIGDFGDTMTCETYLYVTLADNELAPLQEYEDQGFYSPSYVYVLSGDGDSEYGDVVVRGLHGGITRTY